MAPEDPKPTGVPFDAELRKDLRKSLAMFLPTLISAMAARWINDANHPETTLLILAPGIVLQALILVRSTTRQKLKLGWPFLVFLPLYILTFSLAAETGILDWKRTLVGYDDAVPRNFLALNHYGDWHYAVASTERAVPNLAIVLMKPPATFQDGRVEIHDLLAIAQSSGARGVALDSHFIKYKEEKTEEDLGIDDLLCSRFNKARMKGMRVFFAYDFTVKADRIDHAPMDPDLAKCLAEADQGHMIGYAERDGLVRSIPLYFWNDRTRNDPTQEALSLKIARSLNPSVNTPANGLLQFVRPTNDFPTVAFEELNQPGSDRSILEGRFIMAGEDSAQDSFATPFGTKPGVVIHAYAVQSLLRNRFIQRPSWWMSLLMISLWCYLLMVLTARGVANLKLILINVAVSLFIVGIAALAMWRWLIWIDLIYPLLAAWLFLLLLIAMRRIGLAKISPVTG
jgi:hypothetical protein